MQQVSPVSGLGGWGLLRFPKSDMGNGTIGGACPSRSTSLPLSSIFCNLTPSSVLSLYSWCPLLLLVFIHQSAQVGRLSLGRFLLTETLQASKQKSKRQRPGGSVYSGQEPAHYTLALYFSLHPPVTLAELMCQSHMFSPCTCCMGQHSESRRIGMLVWRCQERKGQIQFQITQRWRGEDDSQKLNPGSTVEV